MTMQSLPYFMKIRSMPLIGESVRPARAKPGPGVKRGAHVGEGVERAADTEAVGFDEQVAAGDAAELAVDAQQVLVGPLAFGLCACVTS
jgi:hypothetical protein